MEIRSKVEYEAGRSVFDIEILTPEKIDKVMLKWQVTPPV
ncbi:hypothetical protein ABIB40_002920 [Pedobacter sp. UYP30]